MAIKFIDVKYNDTFELLNIELQDNQIISIVGKSGSGKTALLNLIYGIDINFEGEIKLNESSLNNKSKNKDIDKFRDNIFYVTQDYDSKFFNINILEDIKRRVYNLNIEKIAEYLDLFNLDNEILKKNYSDLSSSELKKILIIMMLISDKRIILLDDPTSGLDYKSQTTLIKLLKKEKRKGKTIFITTQNSDFLLNVSDKIIVLANGKMTEKDNKYEFFEDDNYLNMCGYSKPKILKFKEIVFKQKKVKLMNRDNINDLIKDIYRNAN